MVVQGLGLSAFTAMAQVQSLVKELRSRKLLSVAKKKKKKSAAAALPGILLETRNFKPHLRNFGGGALQNPESPEGR